MSEWLTSDTAAWLGLSALLLVASLALLLAEIMVVSFGLLGMGALGCLIGSILCAFEADPLAGQILLVISPILAFFCGRWGLRRLQNSRLAVQAEVIGDAGYHHAVERAGVGIGAEGTMVTDAYPSGRARFPGGEIDVQIRGGSSEPGTRVRVIAIDGPIVFVTLVREDPPETGG